MVGTFTQPDFETQGGTAYKTNIDNAIAAISEWGASFAPHEQSTPNMTIQLDAGTIFDGTDLIVLGALSTGTITAPVSNPRKDIVYIDPTGGGGSPLVYIGVETGSEGASPADPSLSAGLIPIARINLTTSTTAIANTDIDDLRGAIWDQSSGSYTDPLTTRGDILVRGASSTTRLPLGTQGYVLTAGANDPSWAALPYDGTIYAGYDGDFTKADLEVKVYAKYLATRDFEFAGILAAIETAATGQALIIDVKINGTSVYSVLPQFAATSTTLTAGTVKTDGTEDVSAGDTITVEVTQVGSSEPGEGLLVGVLGTRV